MNYIAFDRDGDRIIKIGPKELVLDAINDYCESGWIDQEDIQKSIKIYELGMQIDFCVETRPKVYFK